MNILSCFESINKLKKKVCCEQLKDSSNLDELRKITLKLGSLHKGTVPYYGEKGQNTTELTIYEQSNTEIVYVAVKKGVVFPEHTHISDREMIAVSKGKLSMQTGALTVVYKIGEFLYINKGVAHKVTVLEDSVLIITFLKTVNGICNAGN